MTTPTLTPVYTDVAAEYRAITEGAGLHDSSYTGRLKATGEDALDLLNRLSTNGIVNLAPGHGAPTILTTDRGRILDLLGVVNTGDHTLLITSPGCQQTVIDWLDKYTIMEDVTVEDISGQTAMFTVCGPGSMEALAKVAPQESYSGELEALSPYSALEGVVAGHEALVIRRPLGDLAAFDVVVAAVGTAEVWDTLATAGATPVGLEAFNAALVQNAVPRHGREMGDAYNPLEAGLIGSVELCQGLLHRPGSDCPAGYLPEGAAVPGTAALLRGCRGGRGRRTGTGRPAGRPGNVAGHRTLHRPVGGAGLRPHGPGQPRRDPDPGRPGQRHCRGYGFAPAFRAGGVGVFTPRMGVSGTTEGL